MENRYWYMFNCTSSPCVKDSGTSFAIRSSKQIKMAKCPVCERECNGPIAWVADVDGGGGPDEPIVAYVRGTVAKIRNELFHFRKDAYSASQTVASRLEQLHGFLKSKLLEDKPVRVEDDSKLD